MSRSRRTSTIDWLLGRPRPSRPDGALRQPVEGRPGTVGIACSGGGIRSAAFNLGALQVLRERGVFQSADYLSAVSGGSYIAASHAIVAQTSRDQLGSVPVYAAGSPEERWLRNHSTYMAPDATVKLRLALNLLYGLVSNLTMLWLGLFLIARPLGWVYQALHPELSDPGDPSVSFGTGTWAVVGGLALSAFLLLFAERMLDRRRAPAPAATAFLRAWSTRVVVAAAVAALLLVVVPFAVLALWEAGRSDLLGGVLRETLSALGFTGEGGASSVQLPVLVAALGAVVGLVTRSVRVASGVAGSRVGRALLPWAGSLLMSLLLVLPFLKWTKDAALSEDWATEIAWTLAALTGVVLHGLFTNINRTSMHPFYKERLCSAFATQRSSSTEAQELPYSVPIRLSSLDTSGHVPELVVCAAANVSQLDDVPPGRGCVSFTFSARECGAPALGAMIGTRYYELVVGARTLTLMGAVSVSGAALSPAMGRFTRPSLRLLLTLANVRLGIWVPNPARRDSWPPEEELGAGRHHRRQEAARAVRRRTSEPGPLFLVREILGRNRWDDRWLYVSDGGHWENLGLLELLRRGCTTLYVVDASGDAPDSFSTLGQAIALARTELGVEIELDPTTMVTDPETGWARCDHAVGTVRYPDGVTGTLGVVKLAVTVDAPWDVRAYKQKDPVFPLHSTIDQLYVDERFEAYRSLGRHTARNLLQAMADGGAGAVITLPDDIPPQEQRPLHPEARRRRSRTGTV